MKDGTLLVLILFGSLVTCWWISPTTAEWVALTLMIGAGIPHGSFDLRVAEAKWRNAPVSRRTILVTYLLCVLGMAALCVFSPLIGLSLFVAISAVHFSEGEMSATVPPSVLMGFALGISAILLPIGLHPQQSQIYMSYFLPQDLFMGMEKPLVLVSHIAAYLIGISLLVSLRHRNDRATPENFQRLICLCAWVLLPPLSGFAVWFIGRHSRQHLVACRAMFARGRFRVPMDFMVISTLAILGLLPFSLRFDFSRLEELFAASICLIAGLTLPHMIVSHRMKEVMNPRPDSPV
jgi:Brp/Blh family beta-carotene 15,15'-monooxygenase